jgi:hypothetical protein
VTTLPSRIGRLWPTIDSLLAQTRPPDAILVNVPRRSVREQREYAVPAWLAAPPATVTLVRCETDHGPGTKLLGGLPHLPPEGCLIVVDDDMLYEPFMVERLAEAQLRRRDASFSFHVYRYGRFRCGQGADGFSFWIPNLTGIETFATAALASPHAFVIDDYWISVFLRIRGIKVLSLEHTLPAGRLVWTRSHADHQLGQLCGNLRRSRVMSETTRFLMGLPLLPLRWRLACALTRGEVFVQRVRRGLASRLRAARVGHGR